VTPRSDPATVRRRLAAVRGRWAEPEADRHARAETGERVADAYARAEPGERDEDRYARAVWTVLAEPGDGVAGALVAALGPVGALEAALGAAPGTDAVPARDLAAGRERWRPRADDGAVTRAFDLAGHAGVGLLTPDDPAWPARLHDLGVHAPHALWVRGDAAAVAQERAIALVGARAATAYGEHVARELAADLAERGIVIVSGAAYGIDGAAHRAALGVHGTTVAFTAGGVDRPYPAGHSSLLGEIARVGAVVSETPCGSAPTRWRFLQRNRLIAAVSAATVVVEAGRRSGSLNTAGHAAALGRPLGAVPGPVTSAASEGCHRLLREYDAICVTSADEVRELIGDDPAADVDSGPPGPAGALTRLGDALSIRVARTVEELAARSGLSVADVEAALGVLHLEGTVESDATGWRRTPREP
jgi:DNA processing protein